MVTLAGLEPATSPAPVTRTLYPPLSYSVVTIFMTVCGGAGAEGQGQSPPRPSKGDARTLLPAAPATKRTPPQRGGGGKVEH